MFPYSLRKIFIFLVLFYLSGFTVWGVTVSGKVTDEKNEPMPFVNIMIKGTTTGSTTNIQGYYQLSIENEGTYTILYKFIGYKLYSKTIAVGTEDIILNIKLEPETTVLQEVVINSKAKDPAYEIIKKAIEKRKYHLKEIDSYKCKAYVKGLIQIDEKPGKILGMNVFGSSIPDDGVVYFSESVSDIYYQQPDKFKEKVLYSKVSGDNKGFSWNSAISMSITFYEPNMQLNISDRGFISPLANNSFMYYRFKLLGRFEEYGQTIAKIQVIPIRKNDPVFSGTMYIVEGSWRIHSVKLKLDRNAVGDYVDSLLVNQTYSPINDSTWVMMQQRFNFYFSAGVKFLNVKGNGYFISVFSNYKVPLFEKPKPVAVVKQAPKTEVKAAKKAVKKQTKTAQKEVKEIFNNEIVVIEKDANKIDTTSWAKIRPIPLTPIEKADYKRKDSIQFVKTSPAYIDSVNKETNKFKISSLLFGYTYRNRFKKKSFSLNPIYSNIQYNTMEGLVLNLEGDYEKEYDDNRDITISPYIRYGFANKHPNAKLEINYMYKPTKFGRLYIDGGHYVTQYNRLGPITPLVNSIYTLLAEQNFLKQYEKLYARIGQRREIANGILLTTFLEYAQRKPLFDATDFTFIDYKDRVFSPNRIQRTHNAFVFDAQFRIRFKQEYFNRPNQKIIAENKYPSLYFLYRKGIPLAGSDIDYDMVSASIEDDMQLKIFGTFSYSASAGVFLNNKKMYFADYRHFNGNQTVFSKQGMNNYFLLDYYAFSTNKYYLEGYAEHHFDGFILNKFPILRKLHWQEIAGVRYLYNDKSLNYAEAYIGLERVFKFFRIDWVTAYQQNRKLSSGIRIGFGL